MGRAGGPKTREKPLDSIDVIRVGLRRWYVLFPVLILAVGSAAGLARGLHPTYKAVGSYAFVYTHADAVQPKVDPRSQNPLVANGPELLGEAVMADLTSSASQTRLGGLNHGYGPQDPPDGSHYSIIPPAQSQTQSYVVSSWADSSVDARQVVQAVLTAARGTADTIQANVGAPEVSRYTTFVTAPTQVIELPPQSRLKLSVAMLFVGLLVGCAASLLTDRIIQRRRLRRGRRSRHGRSESAPSKTSPDGDGREADTRSRQTGAEVGQLGARVDHISQAPVVAGTDGVVNGATLPKSTPDTHGATIGAARPNVPEEGQAASQRQEALRT